jgi:hypothetical protein
MAAPTYVGLSSGGAVAVTTSGAPTYPASLASGDLLEMFFSSDAVGIQDAPGGWTNGLAATTGGGMTVRTWYRTSNGSESGTQTVNVTSGTKGVAFIVAYRPAAGGTLVPTFLAASDTDTSSTAFSATSSSIASAVDNRIVASVVSLAPSGSYAGNMASRSIAQSGATLSNTGRFAGRTGTNTIEYCHDDASVTAGATAALVYTGTANGANAAGMTAFMLITEVPAAGPVAVPMFMRSSQAGQLWRP